MGSLAAGGAYGGERRGGGGRKSACPGHAEMGGRLTRLSVARLDRVGAFHAFRPAMTVTQWVANKPGDA